MKRCRIFLIMAALLFGVSAGCGSNEAKTTENAAVKPVSVLEVQDEIRPVSLHYTGTIEPEETKRYSFKTAGKIAEIFVEEGQKVRKGDKLALLEQNSLSLTELDVDKAQANYDFARDYYEKIAVLHQEGAASAQNLDEAELKMTQAAYSLEQAQKVLELSNDEALFTADSDGYVLSVISRKNETVAAGSPVVALCSSAFKGRIGLTQEDVSQIAAGDEVDVFLNDEPTKGKITIINKIPDEESRTYPVDLSIDTEQDVSIGSIIRVVIRTGTEKGIWIPLNYLLNDGEDYVFVAENGRAKRRNVKLKSILEDEVCVEGLQEGELLITEGMKSVKDGYEVTVEGKKVESVEQ